MVYAIGDGANGSLISTALANYVAAQNPDRFFYVGDVYETGTGADFANSYDPLYGAMAAKTDPVIGNHEFRKRSTGYYPYWIGKRGWTQAEAEHRSYVDTTSGWQVIAYSSEDNLAAEGAWIAGEVAKHPGTCRIAMGHKGRYVVADKDHGDNADQEPVWSSIIDKTAINLVGHNHLYGRLEPINGVTVIVSGAGGHVLRPLGTQQHAVAASTTMVATATRLVLRAGAADVSQVDADGNVYDSTTIPCTPAS
ncbi:MAG: large repetitive protein [Solirubrobacteraceae bacterium]|nr:large repetitive protein [Solirubrobacteraceae bacterium]